MKRGIVVALLLTSGALAVADDKKDEKKKAISFRQWIEKQKMFVKAVDGEAEFLEIKGQPAWKIYKLSGGGPTVGSELTAKDDKDAVVWVVKKISGTFPPAICYVEKKDPPKKE